jgi:hypothetical protein
MLRHKPEPTINQRKDKIIYWLGIAVFIAGLIIVILAISYLNTRVPINLR